MLFWHYCGRSCFGEMTQLSSKCGEVCALSFLWTLLDQFLDPVQSGAVLTHHPAKQNKLKRGWKVAGAVWESRPSVG